MIQTVILKCISCINNDKDNNLTISDQLFRILMTCQTKKEKNKRN